MAGIASGAAGLADARQQGAQGSLLFCVAVVHDLGQQGGDREVLQFAGRTAEGADDIADVADQVAVAAQVVLERDLQRAALADRRIDSYNFV